MKRLFLLFAFVAISHSFVFSQGCLPEGITFTTQEEIDNFQANYPGCTEIEGDVSIGLYYPPNITNLNGLSVLVTIEGYLRIIVNHQLTSLSGLENLTAVESLWIEDNGALTSLSGLESLTSIKGGVVGIVNNLALTNLHGLEGLTFISEMLKIENNYALTNLSGLENIAYIANLDINYNTALISLSGLEGLISIEEYLNILYNGNLNSLSGLENLTTIAGDLRMQSNFTLTSLSDLEGLTSIGGDLWIAENDSLTNLSGLENLNSIGGELLISNNHSLTNLMGLNNIDAGSILNLGIHGNSLLSTCDVKSICDYLTAPNGNVEIYNNAPGCNNPEEVEEHCLTSVAENSVKETITLFPNPASSFITIQIQEGDLIEQAIIYNHLGQMVLETKPVNNTVDVSMMKPGIYFIEVVTQDWSEMTKLIKQ